jgi:AhpD family alkylhydroperoxidase
MMFGQERLSVQDVDPDAYKAVLGLERYVQDGVLPSGLVHLVKIRASELNGCAFCLDMHHREARADGETQRRLDVMSAWREVPSLFTDRERAALALTDAVWGEASRVLDEVELVALLMAIATINVWNRLAVSTHQELPAIEAS